MSQGHRVSHRKDGTPLSSLFVQTLRFISHYGSTTALGSVVAAFSSLREEQSNFFQP